MLVTKKPYVSVRADYLRQAIRALDYKAHDEAGHSTDEGAFVAEDTADYAIARILEADLADALWYPTDR